MWIHTSQGGRNSPVVQIRLHGVEPYLFLQIQFYRCKHCPNRRRLILP